MFRTHNCNELRIENVGEKVKIAGFVSKIRNYGSMVFIDVRDHYGITQGVARKKEHIEVLSALPNESNLMIEGKVLERENKNGKIPTGEIEIDIENIEVFSRAKQNLPFEINENYKNNKEELRLEYRFLDLRNKKIHENMVLRSKIIKDIRNYMDLNGFVEFQTPIFSNSSPEGARDYLIPSRLHPGEFYALPQAPQQFKQLIMASGFDKYYQIAPCFRDEDPRADRSPCEFYQVDFEMAYAEQDDVLSVMEGLFFDIFTKNTNKKVDRPPFRRIPFKDALKYFSIDKPDLRNKLLTIDLNNELKDVELLNKGYVKAILVPKIFTRKEYDNLSEKFKLEYGMNVYYSKMQEGQLSGGISKFLNENMISDILKVNKNYEKEVFDKKYFLEEVNNIQDESNFSMFFVTSNSESEVLKTIGNLRNVLGEMAECIDKNSYNFCFIVDFPMYEINGEGNLDFAHNPFSMPKVSKENIEKVDPLTVCAYQYDAVCNGFEISSGAIRNYDVDMMEKVFKIVNYDKEEIKKKFSALYTAFQYGIPPHAGAAPGLDRIVMLIADETNIREIITFPKNKKARDLMINAPSKVSEEQLKELHIKLDI